MLTHLSLFTGIGGIDIAAERAGFTTVGQCEWADHQTKVLEKHWPYVQRWRDVKTVTAESIRERGIGEITLLSGGFPCQPHSVAGKRMASADERDLSDEFIRVICETKPKWVLGENVPGLLTSEDGRFFGGFIRKLAGLGYCVGWASVCASWVGAIHRRERVFIIAHDRGVRWDCMDEIQQKQFNKIPTTSVDDTQAWSGTDAETSNIFYTGSRIITNGNGVSVRNDNGISKGMDRLHGLGNAVIPEQVYPFLAAIAQIEEAME